ncbi:MAG: hypothetical protein OQL08_07600 [Gammaproteobacteria bacterium]|nr:hypothetical protein [Gammaproteobacteria bacterium]
MSTWGVALLLLLLALLLVWQPSRLWWRARRRQRLISGYGMARLDNVILEDGMGGHKVLEHILLTPQGLRVLLPRHCEGALFAGEKIDSWTQMTQGQSFHFANPLHQLEELLATLRYHLPGIPVAGEVLFSGGCRFPKGRPGRVRLLDELGEEQGRIEQAVVPVLEEAWQQLQRQPRAAPVVDATAAVVSRPRLWLAALSGLAALGWLGWRLS